MPRRMKVFLLFRLETVLHCSRQNPQAFQLNIHWVQQKTVSSDERRTFPASLRSHGQSGIFPSFSEGLCRRPTRTSSVHRVRLWFHPYSCWNSRFGRVHLHFRRLGPQTKRAHGVHPAGLSVSPSNAHQSVQGPQVVFALFPSPPVAL